MEKENNPINHLKEVAKYFYKEYGDTNDAFKKFLEESNKFLKEIDYDTICKIWIESTEIPENDNNNEQENHKLLLKPSDYSDVGQAVVLTNEYRDIIRFSEATNFIVFNGTNWEESNPLAQSKAQELTFRQLIEAEKNLKRIKDLLIKNNIYGTIIEKSKAKLNDYLNEEQLKLAEEFFNAKTYLTFSINRRESKNISSTLKEIRPMVIIEPKDLDKDCFLLNTPKGTYDLRKGKDGLQSHNASDFITKITLVSPSSKGAEIWLQTLELIFCNNQELIDYVQQIVGLCAIGKVYYEAIIISYGEGSNGKSTFWNTISKALGSYSGTISADALTIGCRRNVKPELAEAKGKRLLIASELEEGQRLNTATVKQLASTDEITAEKKFKAPFKFLPSHTLVLYTNHLPKVGSTDHGTWRRLIVIPFNAKIEESSDIKNYSDYLIDQCGESVLAWIILGAKKIYDKNFKLNPPEIVKEAIAKYKEDNHWLNQFLNECCDLSKDSKVKSGELYSCYRNFCIRSNEFTRSTTDFYNTLTSSGFIRHRTSNGVFINGISIKSEVSQND